MSLPYFAAGLPASVPPILDVVPLRLLSATALLRMLDDLRSVVNDPDSPDSDAGAALHGAAAVRMELERRGEKVTPWNPLGEPALFLVSDKVIPFPVRYDQELSNEDCERLAMLADAEARG